MRRAILVGILGLSLALNVTSAFAMPVGPGGSGKSMDDLINDGYSCEHVATGFWECTKKGGSTYWCDASGQCESVRTIDPRRQIAAPRGGAGMTMQP